MKISHFDRTPLNPPVGKSTTPEALNVKCRIELRYVATKLDVNQGIFTMEPGIPGKELCRVRPPKVTEHQGCMKCLAVAPGGTLVTGGRDNAIICWDLRVPQPAVLNVVKYSHKPLAKRSAASLSGSGPTKASVTALDFIDDQVWPLNQFAPFAKKKY